MHTTVVEMVSLNVTEFNKLSKTVVHGYPDISEGEWLSSRPSDPSDDTRDPIVLDRTDEGYRVMRGWQRFRSAIARRNLGALRFVLEYRRTEPVMDADSMDEVLRGLHMSRTWELDAKYGARLSLSVRMKDEQPVRPNSCTFVCEQVAAYRSIQQLEVQIEALTLNGIKHFRGDLPEMLTRLL